MFFFLFFFKRESISWRRHNLTPALKLLENFLLFVNKQDLVLHCLLKKSLCGSKVLACNLSLMYLLHNSLTGKFLQVQQFVLS